MLGTASKLQTARNIKMQGAVSGNVNFDGSGNVTITTTQANIAILTGKLTDGSATISYPTGYNKDNTTILALGFDNPNLSDRGWAYGNLFDASSWVGGATQYKILMKNSGITISTRRVVLENGEYPYVGDSTANHNYKIVLFKTN